MASDNQIEVKIAADASGFRSGAQEAVTHTRNLTEVLREYRMEMKQEGRLSRFLAADIASMGIASKSAAGEITKFVGAFAIGGGIGAAIESVKLLVTSVNEATEAVHAQKEAFKKLEEEAEQYATKTRKHVLDVKAALEGESEAEKIGRTEIAPLLHNKIALVNQLRVAQEQLRDIESNTDDNGLVADIVGLVKAQATVDELKKKIEAVQTKFGASTESAGEIGGATSADARKQGNAEFHRIALAKQLEDTAHYLREKQRITDASTAEATKQLEDYYAEEDAFRQLALNKDIEDAAHFQKIAKDKYDATLAETMAYFDEQDKIAAASAKKLTHELGVAAKELGDAMGKNLAEVLKGTESIDDALNNMLQTMIKVAMQMAVMAALSAGGPLGILGAIGFSAVGSALGGLVGGGGSNGSSNFNITNNFHGGASPGEHSQQMETMIVNVIRNAQGRGRM